MGHEKEPEPFAHLALPEHILISLDMDPIKAVPPLYIYKP
jgi:hypothetical protein